MFNFFIKIDEDLNKSKEIKSRTQSSHYFTFATTTFFLQFFQSVLKVSVLSLQVRNSTIFIDIVFSESFIKFMKESIKVLFFSSTSSFLMVYIFDSLSLSFDIESGIIRILCINKEIFGLFFKDFDIFLMPHCIIDFVNFFFFIIDCIGQLSQILNVSGSAFIVLNSLLSEILQM